eukprot:s1191_g15.t1
METASDMAQALTAVKEEELLLEDGTLIAEEPCTEGNPPTAAENGNDEQQIVAEGTIIAQEAETEEDYTNIKEENQADAENADYQEDSESSKEEDCPIVEVGTIIAQGNQEDGEAAEATSRPAEDQQDGQKRGHSPDSHENSNRPREKNWEEAESARPYASGDHDKSDHRKVLNLAMQWLKTPEEVKKFLQKEEWRSNGADGCFDFVEMNFSKTKMTNDGLREVVKFCQRCPELRVLKLFQNQLDDEGCKELVSVFKDCTGLEELHLSHNWITEKGVEMLATAALENLTSRFSRPFWLRVEHNNFSYASSFMEDLKAKFHPQICGREDRRHCSNQRCIKDCRMHIPFLVDERGSKGSHGNWGRWNNTSHEDWSYNYNQKYKASHKSRSRSPPSQPIRLKERQLSPPMMRAKRPRERADRSPIDRRETYYHDTGYPAYSNRRMRNEPAYTPAYNHYNQYHQYPREPRDPRDQYHPPRAPRAPSPPRRVTRPQSPPRMPGRWPASGRRNRQTPMEPPRPKQPPKQQAPAGPVRRPPSPPLPKQKSQQAQYALPAPLQGQAPPDVDGDSEYSYDYYSDDYSYDDDDEPPAAPATLAHPGHPGHPGHPAHPAHPAQPGHPPVVVPKVKVTREAAPAPMPSRAPKARPPPRQPPAGAPRAPRARARMGEQMVRYEPDPRNPGPRDRPVRQAMRRRVT